MKWILIFLCLPAFGQLPVLPFAPKISGTVSSNTCPTPNLTFGTSNVLWIEASTVSPTDGTPLTSVPNLICNPTIAVVGTNTYVGSGGGSNVNYGAQVFGTNNNWRLGSGVSNTIVTSSNYVLMAVLKFPNEGSGIAQRDIYRQSNGSIQSGGAFMVYSSGRISEIDMQGSGAGSITYNYNDNTNFHLWTFIQSNGVAYIRQDGVPKASGSVGNTVDWGGSSDHTWTLLGNNLSGNFINLQWTRALLWTNTLGTTDLTNYESMCTNTFRL